VGERVADAFGLGWLTMKHVAELDGVRAFAVIAVLAFHADRAPASTGGFIGVDIFFVLSGFLITSILAAEHAATSRIAVWNFYFRRLLRLMPALALLCAVYMLAAPFLWPEVNWLIHLRDVVISLTYFSDYGYAIWRAPEFLRHTWSLAVEEHFYLLWPLVLPAILRSPNPARLLLLGYLLFALWRAINFAALEWNLAYYRFDTRLAGILLGAWLALRLSEVGTPRLGLARLGLVVPLAVLMAVLVLLSWRDPQSYQVGFIVVELASAALIAAILDRETTTYSAARRFLASLPMQWIGKLSYGIYLWHFPISLLTRHAMPYWASLAVCLTIATAMAWVSFHTVEATGRNWKRRLESRTG
jgi:peptidoglycan/LPS O-acetylase OafA/YrhL